ncbi:MAG: Holliday junction branch migration protein RuvA [Clostridia bacterium]|nr:Holliday junction branch migration protein RuvA [Clostridia bacterium]
MYNYIKGKYICSGDGFIVVETGGIGYTIYTSLNTIGRFSSKDNITVYTYLYLREGIMDLYGFATEEERKMFLHLISISGVGPKAAISILSVAPPESIAIAILNGDSKLIQKAQGVGPKVAQRVVMELKDKLKGIEINVDDMPFIPESDDNRSEALSALLVLGYTEAEAKAAVKDISCGLTTEEIIKNALKAMLK